MDIPSVETKLALLENHPAFEGLLELSRSEQGQRVLGDPQRRDEFFKAVLRTRILVAVGDAEGIVQSAQGLRRILTGGASVLVAGLKDQEGSLVSLESYGQGILEWGGQVRANNIDELEAMLQSEPYVDSMRAMICRVAIQQYKDSEVLFKDPGRIAGVKIAPKTAPLTDKWKYTVLEALRDFLDSRTSFEMPADLRIKNSFFENRGTGEVDIELEKLAVTLEYILDNGFTKRAFDPYFWYVGMWLIPHFVKKVRASGLRVHELVVSHGQRQRIDFSVERALGQFGQHIIHNHFLDPTGPYDKWLQNQYLDSSATTRFQDWREDAPGVWFFPRRPDEKFIENQQSGWGSHHIVGMAPDAAFFAKRGGQSLAELILPGPVPPSMKLLEGNVSQMQSQALTQFGGFTQLSSALMMRI